MVDETEIPEGVHEHHHGHGEEGGFRRWSAIYLGVVAMLLAIASLGGGQATKQMLAASIKVNDTYSFAQAKYLRQTAYEIAADQLETQVAVQPSMPDAAKASITALVDKYRKQAARYASDPSTNEGRKELLALAKEYEEARDHAERQDPNFQFAQALFQIAIVLGSVSIVASSRALLGLSAALTICAVLLAINGFFLIVPFPAG